MLTGSLVYKEIEFTFAISDKELSLIPPADKKYVIEYEWKMRSVREGVYVNADPIIVEEDYLIGTCNETGKRIVFLPKKNERLTFHNQVVIISLDAYIIFKSDIEKIDTIRFQCPELNHIYPVNKGTAYQLDSPEQVLRGVIGIETADYEYTTSDKQSFFAFDREISLQYGIDRKVTLGVTQTPLVLTSSMVFRFEATEDYKFLLNMYKLARNFIFFLCYRRNVIASTASLATPIDETSHYTIATMHILDQDGEPEEVATKRGCYIKQLYLSGKEGQILSDIANGMLYMRHLPESYMSSGRKDEARFVMITAAFEWEFRRMYPEGITKSSKTIEAEDNAKKALGELIQKTSGKEKNIYKQIQKNIGKDNLKNEIIQIGKDYDSLLSPFGEYMYRKNGEEFSYSKIGERISRQRNDFAHGNLDNKFRGLALLDLIFLERIVYIMQLKFYGVEEINIKRAVNELFRCGLPIGTVE